MSLFQCENCGCMENTALAFQGFKDVCDWFDWEYAPERKGKRLCSACGPVKYSDGDPTEYGKWHEQFPRTIFPMGEFFTNKVGNLQHRETGLTAQEYAKRYPELMAKLNGRWQEPRMKDGE